MANEIRIAVLQGSVRPGNYTGKAVALVIDQFNELGVTVDLLDPAKMELPLPGTKSDASDAAAMQKIVKNAAGVVLATPEYHGTFSSVIKLMLENLGFPSVLSGKPVALLGVAAGRIGAIKSLESLRGVCSHVGAIALPAPISIAGVQKAFDESGRCLDPNVEKQIRSVATTLLDYLHKHVCPMITLESMVRQQD